MPTMTPKAPFTLDNNDKILPKFIAGGKAPTDNEKASLFQSILGGLKDPNKASQAVAAIKTWTDATGGEPYMPGPTKDNPPTTLSVAVREGGGVSPEAEKAFSATFNQSMCGTGPVKEGEQMYRDFLDGAGSSSGKPTTLFQTMEMKSNKGEAPTTLGETVPSIGLNPTEKRASQNWGPSKMMEGYATSNDKIFLEGAKEAESVGMLGKTMDGFQHILGVTPENSKMMKGILEPGAVVPGKELGEVLFNEKKINAVTDPMVNVGKDLEKLGEDLSKALKMSPIGIAAGLLEGNPVIKGINKALEPLKEAMETGIDASKKPAEAVSGYVKKELGAEFGIIKGFIDGSFGKSPASTSDKVIGDWAKQEESQAQPSMGGKKQDNPSQEQEKPQYPFMGDNDGDQPNFFKTLAGKTASNLAYRDARKKGHPPSQAGDAGAVASGAAQDMTEQVLGKADKSLPQKTLEAAKEVKNVGVQLASKALTAVPPPPLGQVMSIALMAASYLSDMIADKTVQDGANPPQQSPSQGKDAPSENSSSTLPALGEGLSVAGVAPATTMALGKAAVIKKMAKSVLPSPTAIAQQGIGKVVEGVQKEGKPQEGNKDMQLGQLS